MKGNSVLSVKSEDFAVLVVKLCRHIRLEKQERMLSENLLCSGTQIGVHIIESGESTGEDAFVANMNRALTRCQETMYWLRLLLRTEYITDAQYLKVSEECEKLKKMVSSITKLMQIDSDLRPTRPPTGKP